MRAAWPLVMSRSDATEFQSICGGVVSSGLRKEEDG